MQGPICYGHEQIHPRTNLRRVKDGEKDYEIATSSHGLTKREYFAALAMQGLLANPDRDVMDFSEYSATAVRYADELIDELNKEAK